MHWQTYFIEFSYLLASILFILGLKGMSHPETAKKGMHMAEFGMLMAIIGTLMHFEIVSYTWIIVGLLVGSTLGAAMGVWVPMTAMPQRTALSHAFGAFAAALVGIAEYYSYTHGIKPIAELGHVTMSALGFEIMLGSLTTTGSLIAFGKLQGIIPGQPLVYRGQNIFNMTLLAVMVGLFIYLIFVPTAVIPFYAMLGLAFVFGVLLVMPIGSADMPVVMSLLNSYAGLAAAATGFVLGNNVLIIAGTLDGFSGFILSILMCRAMNRSITNVLFGAFGSAPATAVTGRAGHDARSWSRRRRGAARLCKQSCVRAGLWPGHGAGAARGARTGHRSGKSWRDRQVRHSSGRRSHARSHERFAGRSERALLAVVRTRTN